MAGEDQRRQDFEREVLDRLITMETMLKVVTSQCPGCQAKLSALEIAITKNQESTKSAHHRIDGVYKTAGYIAAGVGAAIQALAYVLKAKG